MYQNNTDGEVKINSSINQDPSKPATIGEIIQIISSTIPIITILGTLFGAFITYIYLDSINQKSIFPDIISTPSVFLSVSIVFSLMLFCLFLSLSIPSYILFFNRNKKSGNKQIIYGMNQLLFCLILCSPIGLFLIFILIKKYTLKDLNNELIITLMLIFPLIIYLIGVFSYKIKFLKNSKNFKNIKIKNFWQGAVFSFFIPVLANFYPIVFIFIPISNNWININYHNIFFLSTLFLPAINIVLLSFIIFNTGSSIRDKILSIYLFLFIISFYFYFVVINISDNFPSRLLLPLRIIESNQNSSWYLIHDRYNEKEISGIDAFDLHAIKLIFSCNENEDGCSKTANKRKNALYGYMAWNLGDTKVFCPKSVSFLENKEINNTKKSSKCIIIKSEFIQILDENYISNKSFENK